RRRAAADVDRDVEDLPRQYSHQLSLGLPQLIVQAPQHALLRARHVVLDELRADPGTLELPLVPALEEKATGVAEHLRFDQKHFREPRLRDLHALRHASLSLRSESR